MTHFLVETLEELLRDFYLKFIRPDILANVKTTTSLLKIDVSNRANQLLTSKIDVGFSLKQDLQQLKSKGKITDVQIDKFKRAEEYVISLSQWCTHITGKSPLSSLLAHCVKCFSPSVMVEFPEKYEYLFDKLLMKLVTYKKLAASVADLAKGEFSKFCETVVVENKEEFLSFD